MQNGSMQDVAERFVATLAERQLTVATAESLTAGLVSATIADVPGASNVLRGGAITYATETKASILDVSEARLVATGPVDPEVAAQMASGACKLFASDVGLATTGVAGPGPHDGHPAGTVYVAVSLPQHLAAQMAAPGDVQARSFADGVGAAQAHGEGDGDGLAGEDPDREAHAPEYFQQSPGCYVKRLSLDGNRSEIRRGSVSAVLDLCLLLLASD